MMTSRLAELQIDGLFGLYSHRISLNVKERITIIIGPNGRGKTVCLKFIEALFRKKYAFFSEIPFRSVQFTFTGGEKIRIETARRRDSTTPSVNFFLSTHDEEPNSWAPGIEHRDLSQELR